MLGNDVFAWLSSLPAWQQDLARRLAARVELTDEAYADAFELIKSQFGVPIVGPSPTVQPIQRSHLSPTDAGSTTRLLALGGLRGVGLVSEREELRFAPTGLTLIYGPNAVGKSSYVRALKVLSRTVDLDCRVRSNIYDASTADIAPSAKIEIEVDGAVSAERSSLETPTTVSLAGMSVFDSPCAEFYVDEQNIVQYIPTELRLLARLATLQDRMRRELHAERQALRDTEPSRSTYPPTTEVGRALARLHGADDDPDLNNLAALTDDERARIVELRGIVAAAAASTSRDEALAAKREATEATKLAEAIAETTRRVAEPAAARLRAAAKADATAREALQLAAGQLTGPIDGIGGEPWRLLWEAARSFMEGADGAFPPGAGSPCPLCLQAVTPSTATRMAHFDAHVSSTVQATAMEAERVLTEALSTCAPTHADACRTPLLEALRDREPELAQQLEAVIDDMQAHLETMQLAPETAAAASVDVTPATAALTAWAVTRSRRADNLLSTENPAKLEAVKALLAELEARERLAGDVDVFEDWRAQLRILAGLDRAHSALATNRITSAQRELTESEIGKALDAALTDELKRLSCTHLPVQLTTRTSVAETKVSLKLLANEATELSEIVSEGERRALALCFFFAELTVINDGGGIIVDDPVSSLDDERQRYIADRLVAEAKHRQVIVFTHDLPFLFDLQSQAETAGVALQVQGMWRLGDEVGRVDGDPPFKAMKLKARIGKLKQRVAEWDSAPRPANQDEELRRVTSFYSDLRTTWERAVEERLFQGVVQRFQRAVKTQSLKHVEVTKELVQQIDDGMSRGSMFVHDEPARAPIPLPSRTELAADLDVLIKFAADVPAKS